MSRRALPRRAVAVAAAVALAVALLFLAGVSPSEAPTLEQVLPPRDVAEIERVRRLFEREPDSVLLLVRGAEPLPEERLGRYEAALRAVAGVAEVWSPRTGGAPFLRPDPAIAVLVAVLEPGTVRLSRARELVDALASIRAAPGDRVLLVGTPQLRVASWRAATDDLARLLPLLVAVATVVPLVFFASWRAILFPLVLAALTTAGCLLAYRLFAGPLHALVLLLVPLMWSVATLDAIHLYARRHRHRRAPDPVAAARRALYLPCLLTTLTTAGGLAALAVQGESRLLRSFGLWGAAGTLLAYLLTFTVGGALLSLAPVRRPPPRWPARLPLALARLARRHARAVVVAWVLVLAGAALLAARVRADVRFPAVFAAGRPEARALAAAQELLGIDLAPLEVVIEASDPAGRSGAALVAAAALVTHHARTFPETRFVLPADLLARRSADRRSLEERGAALAADPRLAAWLRPDRGAGRVQVHFAPMAAARRAELLGWLRHFDATVLDHHRLTFGGPAYLYPLAERRGVRGAWIGGALSLLVVALALGWAFRRPRLVAAALTGNLAPLLLAAGLMGVLDIPWSLALLPLPAVLLGLAVDDTVHVLWPCRAGGSAATGAGRAGPALLATTALLAASVGTLALSGLQANRDLGLLLPAGLVLALLCDLSLVPALTSWSRR